MKITIVRKNILGPALLATLLLSACGREAEPEPEPVAEPEATPVSIIRPDIEEAPPPPPLEPLEASIPFADGGYDLSEAALEALQQVITSPQIAEDGAIVLRGHTDSVGHDGDNLRASERRARAVQEWLVDQGIDEERLSVIALGEQRPVEPNANLDGTPNEEGRAANRRVTVTVAVPEPEPELEPEPGVDDTVADPDAAPPGEPSTKQSGE